MKLNVKLFATIKAKAQASHLAIELENDQPTVMDLLGEISRQYPGLESSLKSVLVAVNSEYAFPEHILSGSDEIALFPPVSGG
jgi:molybdopterin converting factor subunit 1